MKKKIIIVFILILLIVPLFMFNDTKASKKEVVKTKKESLSKKKKFFSVENDNINEYIKDNINEEVKEKIIIEERKIKEVSKKEKFKYITSKYDNINEYIKEEIKEEEKIKYICIKEEKEVNFSNENGNDYYYENGKKVKGLKLLNNKRYYFDFNTGELLKENVKSVIDISSWQGNVDFEKVKKTNLVDSVIVRIGYGTTLSDQAVMDSKFVRNISELKRLNIPFSVYLYGYAQNINASNIEVEFIDKMFTKYNISKDTFIWYDAELNTFNNVYYSKDLYKSVVNNFVVRLNSMGYNNVGLYGNLYMLTKGSLSFEKNFPVWVAQYYNKCEYTLDHLGWQYTSDGYIDGINGKVDMNIFY